MTSPGSEYRTTDSIANWSSLRSIGSSTFSKLTMFVPIFGYFILFNENISDYLQLTFDICSTGECRVNWRLFLIYFGLCFAAVGAFIFAALCPDIVKRYSTSREFFETSKMFYAHHHNLRWLLDDIEKLRGAVYDDGLNLLNLTNQNSGVGAEHTNMLSGPMAAYYNAKNKSRARWRWACLLFYGIGAGLLAIPTLWTFVEIIEVAVQRFE
ncbi:hypothetical protein [Mameliella sp.]|uniref:hypothetical protein n=1 Tax=Mameliella sp. TaxID=1924940 RepID=UPI003BAA8A44